MKISLMVAGIFLWIAAVQMRASNGSLFVAAAGAALVVAGVFA